LIHGITSHHSQQQNIMKIDLSFLHKSVDTWNNEPSFTAAEYKISHFKVVNDAAERGVKLAHDFLPSAQLEERYQNVLQVAENARKALPNQRNRKVNSAGTWFLTLHA